MKKKDEEEDDQLAALAMIDHYTMAPTSLEEVTEEENTIAVAAEAKWISDDDIAYDTMANGSLFHNVKFYLVSVACRSLFSDFILSSKASFLFPGWLQTSEATPKIKIVKIKVFFILFNFMSVWEFSK